MPVTDAGIVTLFSDVQVKNAILISVTLPGMMMLVIASQLRNALYPILVSPVKNRSSSNEVISLFSSNTTPMSVTAAASATESSPSPLVSQLATQISFTFASANEMFSTIVLNSLQ